jgi:hypothetical protein
MLITQAVSKVVVATTVAVTAAGGTKEATVVSHILMEEITGEAKVVATALQAGSSFLFIPISR